MKDNSQELTIEIQIKDDDISVISARTKDFEFNQKEKTLLLIALHELKEKIISGEFQIEEKNVETDFNNIIYFYSCVCS